MIDRYFLHRFERNMGIHGIFINEPFPFPLPRIMTEGIISDDFFIGMMRSILLEEFTPSRTQINHFGFPPHGIERLNDRLVLRSERRPDFLDNFRYCLE